ncbi:MAG: hypothetical protein AAF604_21250 [Acidobacteriota bacterium]
MKLSRVAYGAGAWLYGATGAIHLWAHLGSSARVPTDPDEVELLRLATTFQRDMGQGFERSLMDFFNGFSVSLTILCLALWGLNLILLHRTEGSLRGPALFNGAVGVAMIALSWSYFFVPPITLFGLVTAAFLVAAAGGR